MRGRLVAGRVAVWALTALTLLGVARTGQAFEWDLPGERKFSIHGFYEARLLFTGSEFPTEHKTFSSFRHVLSTELELSLFPDGFGPFDSMFMFTRFLVSYECIYTRACGIFNSADSYGDDSRKAVRQPASLKSDVKNNQPYFAGLLPQKYRPGSLAPSQEKLNPGRRYRDCNNPPGVFANPYPLAIFCNLNQRSPLDGPIQGGVNKLFEVRAGAFTPNARESLISSARPFVGEEEYGRLRSLLIQGDALTRTQETQRRTLITEATLLEQTGDRDDAEQARALREQAAAILGTPETSFDANIPELLGTRPDPNRFAIFAKGMAPDLLTAKWGSGQLRNLNFPFLATINTPIRPQGYFSTKSSLDFVGEYEQGLAENMIANLGSSVPTATDADGDLLFKPALSVLRQTPFFLGPDGLRNTPDDLPYVRTNDRAGDSGYTLAPPITGTTQDHFDRQNGGVPIYTQTAQITVTDVDAGTPKVVEVYGIYNPVFLARFGCGLTGLNGTFDPASSTCTVNGEDVTQRAIERGCRLRLRPAQGYSTVGFNADGDCIEVNTKDEQNGEVQFEVLPLLGDRSLRPTLATEEPLDTTDLQLIGNSDSELPARPRAPKQGIYFQSPGQREIYNARHDLVSNLDLKYSVDSLTWNHGASQEEHEFQEGYLEFEMADSQLYARVGKLIVVWGKTELFRNQDRNNPLDIGNGLFGPLEEQRVGQWAVDLTISPEQFMRIGPVEDLRVELLTIVNPFEPTDLGKCGEGAAVDLICLKSFGAMANGLAAIGIVGERRPYDDYEGVERWDWGMRIEGRLDRFTFALSDFWGWDDGFYLDLVQQYERTADFTTGAPLNVNMVDRTVGCTIRTNSDGVPVGPDGIPNSGDEQFPSAGQCLLWDKPDANGVQHLRDSDAVARLQTVNQTIFHSICSFTFDPDEGYCAFDRLNDPRTFGFISNILGGLGSVGSIVLDGVETIRLAERDVIFRQSPAFVAPMFQNVNPAVPNPESEANQDVGLVLVPGQQALLGCGPAYASPCSSRQAEVWAANTGIAAVLTRDPNKGPPQFGGVDLMNADGSVITQEFVGLKALSPGALVGTKLDLAGNLKYMYGINWSRTGALTTAPAPARDGGTIPVEQGVYLDITPNQVIQMGRVGRAEYQIDPNNPREADGWIEPMPWTVNQELKKKFGAIVFNTDPNNPLDLSSPLNQWNLIDEDGPIAYDNIDGEYCSRWMTNNQTSTPFNRGCTGLEIASANFERLLIATEIIGFDRVFDPPESLQEILAWGKANTAIQAAGDPISGPDGIFARSQYVFRDDEVDFDVVRALNGNQLGQVGIVDAFPDKTQAVNQLRDYDPTTCPLRFCAMNVSPILTDELSDANDAEHMADPKAARTDRLLLTMPISIEVQIVAEPNEPGGEYIDTGLRTRVNPARWQLDDVPTLRRFLAGTPITVNGQLVRFANEQRVDLMGRFGDQNNRGIDLDDDGTNDLDRDRDAVWDGQDDGTPGPVTDDNIFCGSGIPGDPLQDGAQYDPYRRDEARNSDKFKAAFPSGLPPRSPVFCRGVSGIVGATTQTLPVQKAAGDGRYGRRDFLWQGGRQVVLNYQKRNVFGFGLDFAEDVTKTSWGIEYSWMANKLFPNTFEYDGLSTSDEHVLSISVDRPTFFNFLNPNRSFFLNLQMFLRYLPGYEGGKRNGDGMYGSAGAQVTGNIVFTFFTGYFQDRLSPRVSILYAPWESQGAVITGLSYRWNDAFSTSIGYTNFFGHLYKQQGAYFPISQYGSVQDYNGPVLRGVAPVLYRDQADLRIRYTW
jgi:hypothetical protein